MRFDRIEPHGQSILSLFSNRFDVGLCHSVFLKTEFGLYLQTLFPETTLNAAKSSLLELLVSAPGKNPAYGKEKIFRCNSIH